jgi:hypothetical protein
VPGVAVALNRDGCKDTDVDEERVAELISMLSESGPPPMDYGYLDSTLREWFSPASLAGTILTGGDHTSRAALEWMSGEGKRWRPYLTAATFLALDGGRVLTEKVRLAAIAVECFHKASLVHDDIQDGDLTRYGAATVHARYGVPIAINVGDMLLGEGYRLLAECGDLELVRVVAGAHVALCRGQGIELDWNRSPREFDMAFVLDICRGKTVPAFDVALQLGAVCAGAGAELRRTLHEYSDALGIAYQLRDDLEDVGVQGPSAVAATMREGSVDETLARERVRKMAEEYRDRTFAVADGLKEPELKRLLFRATERILR